MLLVLLWLGGCALSALSAAALAHADGPWALGVAMVVAAPAALVTARAADVRARAAWPVALAFVGAGALGQHGAGLALYLALAAALLAVADGFAARALAAAGLAVPEDHPGLRRTTTLADPVARELARARREETPLAIASIAVPEVRAAGRRLARIGRELAPRLRRTDAVVLALGDRLVVVLPGGDDAVATAVVARALAAGHGAANVGTATFPRDGVTWAALVSVARERERPWPAPPPTEAGGRVEGRFHRPHGVPDAGARSPGP